MWAWRKPCPHCFLSSTLRHSFIFVPFGVLVEKNQRSNQLLRKPRQRRCNTQDWGREQDEDEIEWIRRCLQQVTKMMKPMKRKGLSR